MGNGDDQAGAHPAGVLHRPAHGPTRGQPAHHRRLPRHLPATATPSGYRDTFRLPRHLPATATPSGYRDTFRLPLRFAAEHTRTPPCELDIADLDAPLVAAFLAHLEVDRRNGVRTRNHRLAAIRSLFSYAALHHPEHAASIQRVLAILERNLVTFLTDDEVDALLAACDSSSWTGRRDHAMITLVIQTGLRISELAGLTCADIVLGAGAHVRCLGKGRKQRHTPLLPLTVEVLRTWLAERHGAPSEPLFPTGTGRQLSRDRHQRR